ncbi:MAG: hypothetical protein RL738_741 [Bacteroidota bacterium]
MRNLMLLSTTLLFLACRSADVPVLVAEDLRVAEGHTDREVVFPVHLNAPAPRAASVKAELVGQTATAGSDFAPMSTTVSWAKGEQDAEVRFTLKGDSMYEEDETLWVGFSQPDEVLLPNPFFTVTVENDDPYSGSDSGYVSPTSYPGYSLVWNEEFDGSALNTANWNYETGAGGWGNNELQHYRNSPSNVRVENGRLIITAQKENFGSSEYTSARVTTQGKKEFQYGRIDIRAKLPKGQGIWPALWMLGANIGTVGWPACGETDIMELIGHEPHKVHGTTHWGVQGSGVSTYRTGTYTLQQGDFSDQYHVFSIIWVENNIRFYVDDQLFHTVSVSHVSPAEYRHNAPFFFIANVAVGGNWPGAPDATTVFPQSMYVDYIRVFQ